MSPKSRSSDGDLGRKFCSKRMSAIDLFTLLNILFKWSMKFSLGSHNMAICSRNVACLAIELLKYNGGWF